MNKIVTTFAVLTLLLGGCAPKQPAHNAQILAFGTLIDVSIVEAPKEQAQNAIANLEQLFQTLHKNWHAWDPSPLEQINQKLKTHEPFTPSKEVLPLLKLSMPLAKQSENLFNPAIGALIDLWGFQGNKLQCGKLPSEEAIASLVEKNPRLSQIQIAEERVVSDNPAIKLDFGAIGKGYGVDLAIEELKKLGIENALVNAGGDLRAIGNRSGRPWRIAIRHPNGGIFGIVNVAGDESVFTSGNYERRYICGDKVYHHIIDPRTGHPARGTKSVTVIHSDAATADAAATALFIAGPKEWHRVAKRMGIRYVALLDEQGTLHINPAMHKRLKVLDNKTKVEISPELSSADR